MNLSPSHKGFTQPRKEFCRALFDTWLLSFLQTPHLFVQVEPLLGPVLPCVLVGEPEEDCAVDGDGLHEDERAVQRDEDHVGFGAGGAAVTHARNGDGGAALALKTRLLNIYTRDRLFIFPEETFPISETTL